MLSIRDIPNQLYTQLKICSPTRHLKKLAWDLRDKKSLDDLKQRYRNLVDIHGGNDQALPIKYEIEFHSWVYEVTGHSYACFFI